MRTRAAILAVVLIAALAACSDSGDKSPSAAVSDTTTVDCAKFADASTKIAEAQTELYSGSNAAASIETLVAELDALKADAPDDVDEALTEMGEAFRTAAEILDDPTPENQAELAALAPKLSEASQKITEYVVDHCD